MKVGRIEQLTHTVGPWRFMTDSTGEYLAVFAQPQGGTKVICPVKVADEADARLIAAAPELLAALKAVLAGFEANAFCRNTDGDGDPAWAIKFFPHLKALADATLAVEKAEGR